MMDSQRAMMKLNRGPYRQFLQSQVAIAGSERAVARKAGISHTTLQRLRDGRDGMTVNVITAQKIEVAFGCPPGIIFLPMVLPGTGNGAREPIPA